MPSEKMEKWLQSAPMDDFGSHSPAATWEGKAAALIRALLEEREAQQVLDNCDFSTVMDEQDAMRKHAASGAEVRRIIKEVEK